MIGSTSQRDRAPQRSTTGAGLFAPRQTGLSPAHRVNSVDGVSSRRYASAWFGPPTGARAHAGHAPREAASGFSHAPDAHRKLFANLQ